MGGRKGGEFSAQGRARRPTLAATNLDAVCCARTVRFVRSSGLKARRVASICSGTYLLACELQLGGDGTTQASSSCPKADIQIWEFSGTELTSHRTSGVVNPMSFDRTFVPSRPFRFLIALILSVITIMLAVLPTNPIGSKWRAVAAAIIFVAYAIYVQLSRNASGRYLIPIWEMVLIGSLAGGAIGILVSLSLSSAAVGFGIGAALGLFADRWTAFAKGL